MRETFTLIRSLITYEVRSLQGCKSGCVYKTLFTNLVTFKCMLMLVYWYKVVMYVYCYAMWLQYKYVNNSALVRQLSDIYWLYLLLFSSYAHQSHIA